MAPNDMSPEERLDALADALAEGFLYLAENGLLEEVLKDEPEGVSPAGSRLAGGPDSGPPAVGEIA